MRVLFLNPIGGIGGAERVLLAAVAGVKQVLPDAVVQVLTLADGPLLGAAVACGASARAVPLPAALGGLGDSALRGVGWRARLALLGQVLPALPAAWQYLGTLRRVVARFRPNLIHSNGIKTHLLARFVVPRRTPVVWHLQDFYGSRPLAARLLRTASGLTRLGVADSAAVAADAAQVLPGLPVRVVSNPVHIGQFSPGPADGVELDRRAGLPPAPAGTVRVGLVATYARWKGHLTVLDAARLLAAEAPDLPLRWYIVGGPIYHTAAQFSEHELRAAAAERGLAGRVGFIGFTPDPAPIYRALDVVVHASTQPEPFGLTVAEAMACGRAVVVSAAGGATELFTENHDALGTAPGDAVGLAAAVRRLANDPIMRARLGANARVTAEQNFDQSRYGPQLIAAYRSVLGNIR